MSDKINTILQSLHFEKTPYVEGRASIADLFRPGKRCGIYVLHFSSGEYYVGQAKDVTRRYIQHCKNHGDIQKISFQTVKLEFLNSCERETIALFERGGFPLRNIALTSLPKGESDFDLIMPEEEQKAWLEQLDCVSMGGQRLINPDLRRKYQERYSKLLTKENAEKAIAILREYVIKGIPVIKSGEISFWASSCLPTSSRRDLTVYSRINIFWQEVFTVYQMDGRLGCSWHLALSSLEEAFGTRLAGLRKRYRGIAIANHRYDPGGSDQICLEIENADTAQAMIRDPRIVKATRLFNLRLMKKGPCVYNRNHCLALADRLLE